MKFIKLNSIDLYLQVTDCTYFWLNTKTQAQQMFILGRWLHQWLFMM